MDRADRAGRQEQGELRGSSAGSSAVPLVRSLTRCQHLGTFPAHEQEAAAQCWDAANRQLGRTGAWTGGEGGSGSDSLNSYFLFKSLTARLPAELNFPSAPGETRATPGAASKHGGYVPTRPTAGPPAPDASLKRVRSQPAAAPEASVKRPRSRPAAVSPPAKRPRSAALPPRLSTSLVQAADLLAAAEAAAEEVIILLCAGQAMSSVALVTPPLVTPPWLHRALAPILHRPARPKSVLLRPLARLGVVTPPLAEGQLRQSARCKENGAGNEEGLGLPSAFVAWPAAKHAPTPRRDSLALTL